MKMKYGVIRKSKTHGWTLIYIHDPVTGAEIQSRMTEDKAQAEKELAEIQKLYPKYKYRLLTMEGA